MEWKFYNLIDLFGFDDNLYLEIKNDIFLSLDINFLKENFLEMKEDLKKVEHKISFNDFNFAQDCKKKFGDEEKWGIMNSMKEDLDDYFSKVFEKFENENNPLNKKVSHFRWMKHLVDFHQDPDPIFKIIQLLKIFSREIFNLSCILKNLLEEMILLDFNSYSLQEHLQARKEEIIIFFENVKNKMKFFLIVLLFLMKAEKYQIRKREKNIKDYQWILIIMDIFQRQFSILELFQSRIRFNISIDNLINFFFFEKKIIEIFLDIREYEYERRNVILLFENERSEIILKLQKISDLPLSIKEIMKKSYNCDHFDISVIIQLHLMKDNIFFFF